MAGEITGLSAAALRDRLASGSLRAGEVAKACLEAVDAGRALEAWAWLDSDHVLQQAEALDALRATGRPVGPLHGLPVGIHFGRKAQN